MPLRLTPPVSAAVVLIFFSGVLFPGPLFAAKLEDLLDPVRLVRHLEADETQKAFVSAYALKLRQTVSDYQWERGKRTCEAAIWQARRPDPQALRTLRQEARKSLDATLDSLKAGLDEKQGKRIDKLLRRDENVLDLEIASVPFDHINNTPLFPRFQQSVDAYRVTLPGTPSGDGWTYSDLLRTWTARGFLPSEPGMGHPETFGLQNRPDLQTRSLSSPFSDRIVKSPLLISATLLVPDLGRAESELLWEHYADPSEDAGSLWDRYRAQNRSDSAILIRMKMSTPFAASYLDLDTWIIYLEDSDGVGYEPEEIEEEALHPVEALEISVPGRAVEVTDVFGNYYPYVPGNKEIVYLEAPAKVVYTGHEKLVKLFFPGKTFQGLPVVTEGTSHLKLIIQSEQERFLHTELVWDLSRKKREHPKDHG